MATVANRVSGAVLGLYRRLSRRSRSRLVIKHLASLLIHGLPWPAREFECGGTTFRLRRNLMLPNPNLIREIMGYRMHYEPRPGDVVVDAGAYTGAYTIYAAMKAGPDGRVIAYEPDPYNRGMLKRNIALNGLRNVVCRKSALHRGGGAGILDVQGYGSRLLDGRDAGMPGIKVATTSLDEDLACLKVRLVNFVKMDVEGAELDVLAGCRTLLRPDAPTEFAVASYHVVAGETTCRRVETLFREHGLLAFSGFPEHPTTYGIRGDRHDLLPPDLA